jgi:hypothetical protein
VILGCWYNPLPGEIRQRTKPEWFSYGIAVSTALMDVETLDRFRHLTVEGAGPQRPELPHLTTSEQALHRNLTDNATANGTGLLLEQERIPWQHAYPILLTAAQANR